VLEGVGSEVVVGRGSEVVVGRGSKVVVEVPGAVGTTLMSLGNDPAGKIFSNNFGSKLIA
jgi:hypothetical protein